MLKAADRKTAVTVKWPLVVFVARRQADGTQKTSMDALPETILEPEDRELAIATAKAKQYALESDVLQVTVVRIAPKPELVLAGPAAAPAPAPAAPESATK